ncbi:MAG: hypothetical protein Q9219_002344 [cf. Caloplaca sp. 3 TL-2023]
MSPERRLTLLSTLVIWSLGSSEAIQDIIRKMYKQQRQNDDRNQPLSVQPWGNDGDKRRYWLVEGRDDTPFRLYRESNPNLKHVSWRSVAGSIDDLRLVITKLDEDTSQASRRLRDSIQAAIPRFEAGEDKRKRREYRVARKAQFTRPMPGFSLYEGRTRGKRIKYTFSEEEDGASDGLSARVSNRHSGVSTPYESAQPTVTASGRQVRSRYGGAYGETRTSTQHDHGQTSSIGGLDGTDDDEKPQQSVLRSGRATRSEKRKELTHAEDSESADGMDDDSDTTESGQEWNGGDEDEADDHVDNGQDDDNMTDDISEDELAISSVPHPQRSLVISLRYPKPVPLSTPAALNGAGNTKESESVSDQVPPLEANPFATPTYTNNHVPKPADSFPHSTNEAAVDVARHQTLHDPPSMYPDKAYSQM